MYSVQNAGMRTRTDWGGQIVEVDCRQAGRDGYAPLPPLCLNALFGTVAPTAPHCQPYLLVCR